MPHNKLHKKNKSSDQQDKDSTSEIKNYEIPVILHTQYSDSRCKAEQSIC